MSGNQDSQGLTGRTIDALDVMLADAVTRVGGRAVTDEAKHARDLAAMAAAARGVATARAAQIRAERLVLKAVEIIEAGETPEAGDGMNDDFDGAGGGDSVESKRATLLRELDAIIAGRAGLGRDAAPHGRGVEGGRRTLGADGATEPDRGLAVAA